MSNTYLYNNCLTSIIAHSGLTFILLISSMEIIIMNIVDYVAIILLT